MAKKFSLGIIRKFATLALSLLCISPLVSSALIFPKVIKVMILDYLEDDCVVMKLPSDAQIAVYKEGIIYWSNNELCRRKFGKSASHIYQLPISQRTRPSTRSQPNRVPLLALDKANHRKDIILGSVAVSNDGTTVALTVRSNFRTYAIRDGRTRTFDDHPRFPTLISGDGRRVLTVTYGRCYAPGCCRLLKAIVLLSFVVIPILCSLLEDSSVPNDVIYRACFGIGGFYILRAICVILGTHGNRYEVYDLASPSSAPIEIIPKEGEQPFSENFDRVAINEAGMGTTVEEDVHPAFRPVERPEDSDCSYGPMDDPKPVIICSMDRETSVSVTDVGDELLVALPTRSRAFATLFDELV